MPLITVEKRYSTELGGAHMSFKGLYSHPKLRPLSETVAQNIFMIVINTVFKGEGDTPTCKKGITTVNSFYFFHCFSHS